MTALTVTTTSAPDPMLGATSNGYTARASSASYYDINGVLRIAAVNVLRNQHYLNGVLQPPLIEGASTNLLINSEVLDNPNGATVSANVIAAPDGNVTGDKLVENSGVGVQHYAARTGLVGSGTIISASCFAKKAERTILQVGANATSGVKFDLNAGTIFGTSGPTGRITALGNGWYRCEVLSFPAGGGQGVYFAMCDATGAPTYNGDGVSGLYIWGRDMEPGTQSTSYIPTGTITAQRAADIDLTASATASGYTRQVGSFLTDGFRVGMVLTPVGFGVNTPSVATYVSDQLLLQADARYAEPALAGRSLSGVLQQAQVVATDTGFDGLRLHRRGEVFNTEYTSTPPSWTATPGTVAVKDWADQVDYALGDPSRKVFRR